MTTTTMNNTPVTNIEAPTPKPLPKTRTPKPAEKAPFQHVSIEFLVKTGKVDARKLAEAIEQYVKDSDLEVVAMTGFRTSDATIQRRRSA